MKDVKLGSSRCDFGDEPEIPFYPFNNWDEGQNCIRFCIDYANQNNWKKGCCEAEMQNGRTTTCRMHDTGEVTRPGKEKSKAVQCTGILTSFKIT